MKKLIFGLVSVLVSVASYAAPTIPREFQGKWALNDVKNCAANEDTVVKITSNSIGGYETSCKLVSNLQTKSGIFVGNFSCNLDGEDQGVEPVIIQKGNSVLGLYGNNMRWLTENTRDTFVRCK